MAEIANLGYVVFEASDLDAWGVFAADIVGAVVDDGIHGQIGLKIDEHPWRVQIVSGDQDDILAAGWELPSEDALEEFVADLRANGAIVEASDAARRCVSRLYTMADPTGFDHEFYTGRAGIDWESPKAGPVVRGEGFVTGDLGVGHIVVVVPDYVAAVDWYGSSLRLRSSDRIIEEIMPGVKVDVAFFHTATGRHHSLATAEAPGSKILNHFMLEYASMGDVGAAFDRVRAANIPVVMDLGQHPNDGMFSFYVQTPSGFALELGFGGLVIDRADWQPKLYDRLSDWGHKRVAAVA